MRERWLLGATAVPFVVAALLPGSLAGLLAGDELSTFQDPDIVESSALVALGDGRLVTSNDSGDSGRLFTVDAATGRTVQVTRWSAHPVDVEALAPAPDGTIWVGDIGDNESSRSSVSVTPVALGPADDQGAAGPTYELVYPDGPHDAESLLCDPATGRLYLASKSVFGGTLYAAPRHLVAGRANRLTAVGPVLPIATDAAFFPGGRDVIVRSYGEAAVYRWPDLTEVAHFGLPAQHQGEGIGVAADGTVFASSEGLHAPLLRIALPPVVEEALTPAIPSGTPTPQVTQGTALPADTPKYPEPEPGRSSWTWVLGGLVGAGIIAVLIRSLRPD